MVALWKRVRQNRHGRRLAILAVCLLLLYGTRSFTLTWFGKALDVSSNPQQVDYVMVLGGDANTRPFVAAALVKGNMATRVLLGRVILLPENVDGLIPSEHELALRALVGCGVPREQVILLPGECRTTYDEAQALAAFLESHTGCSVAIVTSPYHTRRVRWVFQRVLGPRATSLHYVAAPSEDFNDSNWWQTDGGTQAYLSEYLKLAFYLVRY